MFFYPLLLDHNIWGKKMLCIRFHGTRQRPSTAQVAALYWAVLAVLGCSCWSLHSCISGRCWHSVCDYVGTNGLLVRVLFEVISRANWTNYLKFSFVHIAIRKYCAFIFLYQVSGTDLSFVWFVYERLWLIEAWSMHTFGFWPTRHSCARLPVYSTMVDLGFFI